MSEKVENNLDSSYTMLPNILFDLKLQPTEFKFLALVAKHKNFGKYNRMSNSYISEALGMNLRTVKRIKNKLLEKKIIYTESNGKNGIKSLFINIKECQKLVDLDKKESRIEKLKEAVDKELQKKINKTTKPKKDNLVDDDFIVNTLKPSKATEDEFTW